jgi:hypothetical protein
LKSPETEIGNKQQHTDADGVHRFRLMMGSLKFMLGVTKLSWVVGGGKPFPPAHPTVNCRSPKGG